MPASVRWVTSLLIRNARLVPLREGESVPDRPVDVAVERGVVTAVGAGLEGAAGAEEIDAGGRWVIPGLWDQHTHLAQWTLYRAFRNLVEWRQVHDSLWLAINVRPSKLVDQAFQAGLHAVLETHQLPPAALVVEMAEQDLLRVRDGQEPAFEDVVAQLGRLRAEGIRTAVDNFGSGPTSLSRLRVLPVDLLKIDREGFGLPAETLVLDVAVTLGRRLGLEVIAHGLRDAADLDAARTAGCRLGQGDLLGRPMPAERLEAFLDRSRESQRFD